MRTTMEAFRPATSGRTVNFGGTIEGFLVRLGLALSNSRDFEPYDRDEMLLEPISLLLHLLSLFVAFSSVSGACNDWIK